MTVTLALAATAVAIAAAARSTWSPCGLSMLSTITPVSERAKGNSYRWTATWFVIGAVVGGATLGVMMAFLAEGIHSFDLPPAMAGLLALGAALVVAASDVGIGGFRLPIHRRQVNERWLDHYRPWVYGAGFGWQIGSGISTYITTAAVYLMVVLGALTGDPLIALAVGTTFGVLRGLAVLLTRRSTNPSDLLAFHRRFQRAGPVVGRITVAVEAGAVVVLVGYLRSPVALATGVVAIGGAVACAIAAKRDGLVAGPTSPTPNSPAMTRSARSTATIGDSEPRDPVDPVDPVDRVEPDDLVGHGAAGLSD
jgi:hypothetical protein